MTKKQFTKKVFKIIEASSNNTSITIDSKLKDCNLTICDENEIEAAIDDLIGYNNSFILDSTKTIKENIDEAFKMGIATGSASAFSDNLATEEEVYNLLKQM